METQTTQITPYTFQGLPKLSRKAVLIEEGLLQYLPFSSENIVKQSLETFLSEQFHVKCHLHLDRIEETTIDRFVNELPLLSTVAILGLQPIPSKCVAWIDEVLASSCIYRILGGKDGKAPSLKTLTHIEEGVLQYFILKILKQIRQACQDSNPVHFRLENLLKSQKEVLSLNLEDQSTVALRFRIQIGSDTGFIVIGLPHPFAEAAFLKRDSLEDPERSQQYQYQLKRFGQVAHTNTQVWLEVGAVSLTISEKNQLEKGDVILFDETHCQMVEKRLMGNAILRVGEGKNGGFFCQVVSGDNPVMIKILDYC